jgi:hypothetical protein
MGDLFLGDGAAVGQHLAAVVVLLSLLQFGLAGFHLRLERVDVAVQAAHLAHAARQFGLGGLQGHSLSAGSNCSSTCPACTRSPSSAPMLVTVPVTRVISTTLPLT